MYPVHTGPAIGLSALLALLAALAATTGLGAAGWLVGIGCGLAGSALLVRAMARRSLARLGPADRVTLTRAVLVGGVAALTADSVSRPVPVPATGDAGGRGAGAGRRRRLGGPPDRYRLGVRRPLRHGGRRVPDPGAQLLRRRPARAVGAADRAGPLRLRRGRLAAGLAARAGAAALLAQGGRRGPGRGADGGGGRPAAAAGEPGWPSRSRWPCSPSRSATRRGEWQRHTDPARYRPRRSSYRPGRRDPSASGRGPASGAGRRSRTGASGRPGRRCTGLAGLLVWLALVAPGPAGPADAAGLRPAAGRGAGAARPGAGAARPGPAAGRGARRAAARPAGGAEGPRPGLRHGAGPAVQPGDRLGLLRLRGGPARRLGRPPPGGADPAGARRGWRSRCWSPCRWPCCGWPRLADRHRTARSGSAWCWAWCG